jgi:mono/diheme cytochrome c family protein
MTFRWLSGLGLLVLVLSPGAHARQATSPAELTKELRDGQKIFQTRCAMCHVGQEAVVESVEAIASEPMGPRLSKANVLGKEDRARQLILNGSGRMPGFKLALKTEQVEHLLGYLKTLDAPVRRLVRDRPGE